VAHRLQFLASMNASTRSPLVTCLALAAFAAATGAARTAAAEARGWATSEQKNNEYLKELAAKGMKVAAPSEALTRELRKIGATMTAEWLKQAGPDGQAVIDTFSK